MQFTPAIAADRNQRDVAHLSETVVDPQTLQELVDKFGARFNELLAAARSELDDTKRREMYGEMQGIVSNEGGVVIPPDGYLGRCAEICRDHGVLVLNDEIHEQRQLGMKAGMRWLPSADALVVYQDKGISDGMRREICLAEALRVEVEYRELEEVL